MGAEAYCWNVRIFSLEVLEQLQKVAEPQIVEAFHLTFIFLSRI